MKHSILLLLLAACALALPARSGEEQDLPLQIPDATAPDWVVDRFAGNSTAGPLFLQGPAPQTGGLGTSHVATAPDGSVFLTAGMDCKWAPNRIARVAPDGTLRLVAGGGASLLDGPAGRALVRAENIRYSNAEQCLYFVHRSIPCLRKLYQKDGQWRVETVAGNPEKAGATDGPAKEALFGEPRSLAVARSGAVYVLDGTSALRKVEGGQVSTVTRFKSSKDPVDGPYTEATMNITQMSGNISMGDDDDTLYVADHWHFAARKIDLKAGTVTRVVGMNRPGEWRKEKQTPMEQRYNDSADGPALTHASFNSGCAWVVWDGTHKALWVGGPDEWRLRWLKDGQLTTPLPFRRDAKYDDNSFGTKPDAARFSWTHVADVDGQGRVYLNAASSKTGVWRATLQKKEGGQ